MSDEKYKQLILYKQIDPPPTIDYSKVKWAKYPLHSLIKEVSFIVGSPDDKGYQKITYRPCRKCGELTVVEDIANGYYPIINNDECSKCIWSFLFKRFSRSKNVGYNNMIGTD